VSCMTFFQGDSVIHRLDPRVKVVACVILAVLAAVSGQTSVVGLVLGLAVILLSLAELPFRPIRRRFVRLNLLLLLVLGVLCLSMPGAEVWRWGGISVKTAGAIKGAMIVLKANAVVLLMTVLLGTIEIVSLGHALAHLKIPPKLIQIFLFTVRYVDVLHNERLQLSRAMKVRCFQAGMNTHTWRSLGYLVGMLFVKSLDRSERIYAAMKCRGFTGRFYLFRHFAMRKNDYVFIAAVLMVFTGLAVWEVICRIY